LIFNSTSQLFSLLLALFSISLAALFYFKATDTSNKFYDNTYKFTQQTSEILNKIESGFGEKLSNLSSSYEKIQAIIMSDPQVLKLEKHLQEEESKIVTYFDSWTKEISDSLKHSNLQREIREQLERINNSKSLEYRELKEKVASLRKDIASAKQKKLSMTVKNFEYLDHYIGHTCHPFMPPDEVAEEISINLRGLDSGFISELADAGYVTRDTHLTDEGKEYLIKIIEKIR
jgi:ATP-dependent Lon protease